MDHAPVLTRSDASSAEAQRQLARHPSVLERLPKRLFEIYTRAVFRSYAPLHVAGRDNLPRRGAYILCSNHNSHIDTGILMDAGGRHFEQYAMLAAKDYWFDRKSRTQALGHLLMCLIPLQRHADDPEALEQTLVLCEAFLSTGERSLVLFPEGTRSTTGKMGRFRKGAAYFALRLGVPIVPVNIQGSANMLPKSKKLMRPARLSAVIGTPLNPYDYLAQPLREPPRGRGPKTTAIIKLTNDLERSVRDLGAQHPDHAS